MSAFLVSPECINSIVTYMYVHRACFDWFTETLHFNLDTKKGLSRFAEALHQLNCDSIAQRYGKEALKMDLSRRKPFAFRAIARPHVEVYKAVWCLSYQCSEGDIPTRALFKALMRISRQVAERIVWTLPEYEAAPWGD